MVSSCSQEEIVQQQTVSLSDCKFIASFEQTESRTYLEDGKYLRWTANDELSVFMGKTLNRQFRFTGETGDNSGGFEEASSPGFVTGNDLDNPCHYAIYPYAKGTKITETGVLTVNLPSEQTYEENSFGCGANTMVAVTSSLSDMELSFKNACGYLKFKLYGDDVTVKSVTLQSNGEEKLSGSATLTSANDKNPSIAMSSTASNMITLDCGTGVKIGSTAETATEFWFVVPPTTFESGFTVTIKDVNDNEFTKSTSKKISIERNIIKPISAFEVELVELVETIPNNQIWYTSYTESIIEPYVKSGFGANIIENTYNNGKGIITFDEDITTIPAKAFYKITHLETITLPSGIKSIRESAFENCELLTTINFSNSLQSIGDKTFYNCKNLATIKLPESLTSIGKNAFSDCSSIIELVIPDKINKIESGTFSWCNKMKHITIPNTVKSIESSAFWACQSLESIKLPDNLTYIGSGAFYACNMLENVIIPDNVLTIGDACFESCDKLSEIHVGASVTNIGNGILQFCNSLKSIEGKYASNDKRCLIKDGTLLGFAGNGITEYSISNDVKLIGSYVMAGRSDLTSITISDSVTLIEEYAFGWTNLTTVNIGKGLKAIGNNAFAYSADLVNVYCNVVTPPICGSSAFYHTDSQLSIFVPTLSVEEYMTAENWSGYASRIKGYEF